LGIPKVVLTIQFLGMARTLVVEKGRLSTTLHGYEIPFWAERNNYFAELLRKGVLM
jgi:hypothetical protein